MAEFLEKHRDDMSEPCVWRSERVGFLPHYHAGVELVYVLSGELSAMIDGQSVRARAGEMLVSGAYAVHSYGEENARAIVAIIPPSVMPQIQKQLLSGRFIAQVCADGDGRLGEFMLHLEAYIDDEIVRVGICYALIGILMRAAGFAPSNGETRAGLVARVLKYLSENYTQPVSVETLSRHFGYSRSRFSHIFKSSVGVSVPRYVNILRCRAAARALLETDGAVMDIAIDAGFNNAHTFYAAFKDIYHMTPAQYARAQSASASDARARTRRVKRAH